MMIARFVTLAEAQEHIRDITLLLEDYKITVIEQEDTINALKERIRNAKSALGVARENATEEK